MCVGGCICTCRCFVLSLRFKQHIWHIESKLDTLQNSFCFFVFQSELTPRCVLKSSGSAGLEPEVHVTSNWLLTHPYLKGEPQDIQYLKIVHTKSYKLERWGCFATIKQKLLNGPTLKHIYAYECSYCVARPNINEF